MIKLGAQGCYVSADGIEAHIPAFPCRCVDTTGAGDTFCAAFVLRWLESSSVGEAARFAVAASGLSVGLAHVLDGLPRREEL